MHNHSLLTRMDVICGGFLQQKRENTQMRKAQKHCTEASRWSSGCIMGSGTRSGLGSPLA